MVERRNALLPILCMGLILVVPTVALVFNLNNVGSVYREIAWEISEDDVYYMGIKDDYWWQDRGNATDEFIRTYRGILRSEIIDKKDLPIDQDNESDLIILSSVLLGREDYFSIEFPNYFDIYQLIANGYNLFQIISRVIEEDLYGPNATLVPWGTPNAIHFQVSGIYQALYELIDYYNIGEFSTIEFPEFEDIYELIDWFSQQDIIYDGASEDFETDILGAAPSEFTIETTNPPDNLINVQLDPDATGNNIVKIQQEPLTTDGIKMIWNAYKNWIKKTELDTRVDLDNYWFIPSELGFDLQFDSNNMEHVFQTSFLTDYFDILGTIDGEYKLYRGFNGINFRFEDGFLQYYQGNYTFDGSNFRESYPTEIGWHNVPGDFKISDHFFDGGPDGHRFKVKVTPDVTPVLLAVPSYTYTIAILKEDDTPYSTFVVPVQYDCPYDFMENECFDNLKGAQRFFRFNNLSNVVFNISNTQATETDDILDNFFVKGKNYHLFQEFQNLVGDYVFSEFVLLSIYHLLFFPNDFPWDAVVSACTLFNQLFKILMNNLNDIIGDSIPGLPAFVADAPDLFNIYSDNNTLNITITYDTVAGLEVLVEDFIALFNLRSTGLLEGDTDIQFSMTFDKRINCMNGSFVTIQYNDLGITRQIGLHLLAARNKTGGIYDWYPEFPPIDWEPITGEIENIKSELVSTAILGYIITSAFSIGISSMIALLIAKRIKKRLN